MSEKKRSSSIRTQGIAKVLEDLRDAFQTKFKQVLLDRKSSGASNLDGISDAELETIIRAAGSIAREVAGDAVGQAYQLGVDRNASPQDFERKTLPPPPSKSSSE